MDAFIVTPTRSSIPIFEADSPTYAADGSQGRQLVFAEDGSHGLERSCWEMDTMNTRAVRYSACVALTMSLSLDINDGPPRL